MCGLEAEVMTGLHGGGGGGRGAGGLEAEVMTGLHGGGVQVV